MKTKFEKMDKEAVSPVIGVILMVAITVVLAAILYVWVVGMMTTGEKNPPAIGGTVTSDPDGWRIDITRAEPAETVLAIDYVLSDINGNLLGNANLGEDAYYNFDENGVKFVDSIADCKIGGGDSIVVKDTDSGGLATNGATLRLIFNDKTATEFRL